MCLRRYADAERVLDQAVRVAPQGLNLQAYRAAIDLRWHANPHPLSSTIQAIIAEDSREAINVAQLWLEAALCERDFDTASRALAADPISACYDDWIPFLPASCEGAIARMRGDTAAAAAAFTTARNEAAKLVTNQPDYPEALCALGVVDTALGNKADAIREAGRAVELMPVSKNAIEGHLLIKYLGIVYAWGCEKNLACEQLEIAAKVPGFLSYGELRLYPNWDPLHGDPQFEKIAASLGTK